MTDPTDEPQTTYYPTGFVQRITRAHSEPPTQRALPQRSLVAPSPAATNSDAVCTLVSSIAPRAAQVEAARPLASKRTLHPVVAPLLFGSAVLMAFVIGRATNGKRRPLQHEMEEHSTAPSAPATKRAPKAAALAPPADVLAPPRDPEPIGTVAVTVTEAVAALASGDYVSAVHHYGVLAAARPHAEAFAAVSQILQRKLAKQCEQAASPGDPSCSAK